MVICLFMTYHCLFCFVLSEVERSYIMRESKFQADLKKKLKSMFPGCIVTKMDPTDIQGMRRYSSSRYNTESKRYKLL